MHGGWRVGYFKKTTDVGRNIPYLGPVDAFSVGTGGLGEAAGCRRTSGRGDICTAVNIYYNGTVQTERLGGISAQQAKLIFTVKVRCTEWSGGYLHSRQS